MYVKASSTILPIIILFITNYASISCHGKNSSTSTCMPEERKALLKFRQSLSDPSNRFSSWNKTNCCEWEGVTCDNITRHVIKLDLRNTMFTAKLIGKNVDSSLAELKHLSHLDLSFNDFQLSQIPAFLGSMNRLQYLNLSFGNFSGAVPDNLGNLSNLRALDLNIAGDVEIDDLSWASNLTSLEALDLGSVNLSRTKNLLKVFGTLPSLVKLVLTDTGIDSTNVSPDPCPNSFPLASIRYLHLSWNLFHGEFPCFILNMTWLNVLALSNNALTGHIPTSFGNFSSLTELYLSYNAFSGHIPASLTNLTALTQLHMSTNNFSGPIPSSIGNLRALKQLTLDFNQLSGEIPISLGQLSNLNSFDISWNSFNGTLSEAHFANLSMLEWLATDYNMLHFEVGIDWVPPFQLRHLSLRSTKIGGQFPRWLRTQKNLVYLELTNTSISGDLPRWLSYINYTELHAPQNRITGLIPNLSSTIKGLDLSNNMMNGSIPISLCQMKGLDILDLSENYLSGKIPDCLATFQYITSLRLSSNELTGIIPDSFGAAHSLIMLHLSYNNLVGQIPLSLKNCTGLSVLDLGNNKLTGNLPDWIGTDLIEMVVLRLRDNNFSGVIPNAFCQLTKLQILDLANNNLTGQISSCFGNLFGMIKGSSSEVIPYPHWYDESYNQVLKGSDMEYVRISTKYVVNLDLSCNHLVGDIPSEVTNLSALIGFNVSHNRLGGRIPTAIGNMKSLESIDLSNNNLSANIPRSLSELTSLSYLNLSHNNLSGRIPTGSQLQTFNDPSIYDDNPVLCGTPLPRKCPESSEPPNVDDRGETDEDDRVYTIYFYGVIMSGFGTGFWGFIGVLILKWRWRQAYFNRVEVMMSRLLSHI